MRAGNTDAGGKPWVSLLACTKPATCSNSEGENLKCLLPSKAAEEGKWLALLETFPAARMSSWRRRASQRWTDML